ncbi:MAG: CHAD domain-containing protein [Candidatus Hinthialibacter antarcticus]|nr:CHAD domain-containing protein [Candidatus Hinthialibacter antarcticus]
MLKTFIQAEEIPQELLGSVCQDDSAPYAARKILAKQFTIVLRHQEAAIHTDDPEALHQVRLAIRRMRTCLRVMKPMLGDDLVGRLMPGMKRTGSILGDVRDLDSFIIWLSRIREFMHFKVRVAIDAIERESLGVRKQEKQTVIDELESDSYSEWTQALLEFLHSDRFAETTEKTLRDEAPGILTYLLSYVSATTKDASSASFKKLHKLRIRCKWLRYFCEFFNDAYGDRLQPVIKEIKVMQSELGIVQDHSRDIKMLTANKRKFTEINCVDDKSVAALIQFFSRQRRNTRKRFKKIWKDYTAKNNQKRYLKLFKKFPSIEESPVQSRLD